MSHYFNYQLPNGQVVPAFLGQDGFVYDAHGQCLGPYNGPPGGPAPGGGPPTHEPYPAQTGHMPPPSAGHPGPAPKPMNRNALPERQVPRRVAGHPGNMNPTPYPGSHMPYPDQHNPNHGHYHAGYSEPPPYDTRPEPRRAGPRVDTSRSLFGREASESIEGTEHSRPDYQRGDTPVEEGTKDRQRRVSVGEKRRRKEAAKSQTEAVQENVEMKPEDHLTQTAEAAEQERLLEKQVEQDNIEREQQQRAVEAQTLVSADHRTQFVHRPSRDMALCDVYRDFRDRPSDTAAYVMTYFDWLEGYDYISKGVHLPYDTLLTLVAQLEEAIENKEQVFNTFSDVLIELISYNPEIHSCPLYDDLSVFLKGVMGNYFPNLRFTSDDPLRYWKLPEGETDLSGLILNAWGDEADRNVGRVANELLSLLRLDSFVMASEEASTTNPEGTICHARPKAEIVVVCDKPTEKEELNSSRGRSGAKRFFLSSNASLDAVREVLETLELDEDKMKENLLEVFDDVFETYNVFSPIRHFSLMERNGKSFDYSHIFLRGIPSITQSRFMVG